MLYFVSMRQGFGSKGPDVGLRRRSTRLLAQTSGIKPRLHRPRQAGISCLNLPDALTCATKAAAAIVGGTRVDLASQLQLALTGQLPFRPWRKGKNKSSQDFGSFLS